MLSSEDLTAAILSQLTWLPDILRCSAVSKTWLAASHKLQLHALDIPGDYEETENCQSHQQLHEGDLDSVARLVQHWHKTGTFCNLTSLSLHLESGCTRRCRDGDRLPGFVESIMIIAGMWDNLQHCLIHGVDKIGVPGSLLPSKLQSLEISFKDQHGFMDCMSLSLLQRLSSLRSLCIGPFLWDLDEDYEGHSEEFILESTFHKLTKLHLQYLPLRVSAGFTLSGCLPNLTDLHVRVFPSEAQAVLDLPRLTKLSLGLVCKTTSGFNRSRLMMPSSSTLEELYVWGSANSCIKLCIRKLDLKFRCRMDMIDVEYNCPRFSWTP